ncbi:MAG: aldehyde dehydrogenase family protein, partial [Terriglobia bacterium]
MAKMIIGGKAAESASGQWTEVRNPALRDEVVGRVPKGTVEDVQRAVEAAAKALPAWSALPSARRGEVLHKAVHLIHEHAAELAELLTREQGKPLSESVRELRRFAHTLEHYAGLAKNIRGGHIPQLDEGKYGLILKRPIGICGAIVPWNFPVSLMGNKLGPALLAGNAVIVKPASTTPLTAIRCVELLCEAGVTPGALNLVTGPGGTVGEEILKHPAIRKIGFTGETRTGKHVMEVAAQEIKRVTLELGGSDPMIVADDAELDAAVSAASVGRFYNCGQACLAIKRLYLFERIHDGFVEKLIGKVKRLKLGNGLNQDTRLGPL